MHMRKRGSERVLRPRISSPPRRGIPTLCYPKLAAARRADAFLLIDVILKGLRRSLVSRVYVTIALFTVINVAVSFPLPARLCLPPPPSLSPAPSTPPGSLGILRHYSVTFYSLTYEFAAAQNFVAFDSLPDLIRASAAQAANDITITVTMLLIYSNASACVATRSGPRAISAIPRFIIFLDPPSEADVRDLAHTDDKSVML